MPEWDALTIDRTASAALGQAAAAIGRESFYRLLLAAVGCFIPHDLSAVMRYSAFSKPDLLLGTDYGPDFTGSYAQDLYRYDPFYRYWRDVARPGVVSLADVVATEADRRHYVGAILHDVSVSDEIGMFLPPIGQSSVALFLDRRAGSYTELDLARARLIYDLVAGLHAAHVGAVFGDGQIARGNAGALLAGPKPTRVLDRERHEIARNVGWSTCEAQHETILAEALAELADAGQVRIGCTLVLRRTPLPATFYLAPSGDPGVAKAGLVDRVLGVLAAADLQASAFTDVESDPDVVSVEKGTALAKAHGCDSVVGIGGGSALDTAKAIGLMLTNPGHIRDYVGIGKVRQAPVPVVAIPTTAGTGSEVTIWSVLTDKARGEKVSVGSVLNCPRVGLLNPELTVSLPPAITAQTGMDALTHAVESYVNTASNPLSEAPAEQAIRLIGRSLRRAVGQPMSADARAEMLLAGALAGVAFNATRLGYVHAFALPLGAKFKIPHGLVNAIMLPVVMRFNVPGNLPAFARIATLLGSPTIGLTDRDAAFTSVIAVEQLRHDIGITETLADFGVTTDRFDEIIDEALLSGNCAVNPRQATRAQLRTMLADGCKPS